MIDTLYAVGHRLLGLGFGTPFLVNFDRVCIVSTRL